MTVAEAKQKSKKKLVKKTSRPISAMAIHDVIDDNHIVGIGNLRVIVCEDDGIWFAQGLEIDYAANGNSFDQVKRNFEHGLSATIGLHLQVFDTIEKLLVPAPSKVWRELSIEKRRFRFSQFSAHQIEAEAPQFQKLPYSGISYMESGCEVPA